MRRRMILAAVGATALSIGLGVGATLHASADSTPPTPTGSTTMMDAMDASLMNGGAGMTSMMSGNGMATMMGADGMAAMHTAMHQSLADSVPADVLAACDEAHTSMTAAAVQTSTDVASEHDAHHSGRRP